MNRNDSGARVALVTGGAMGIGASISAQLAARGHTVLVADINLEAASKTADALVAAGHRAAALQMDLGSQLRIHRAGFQAVAAFPAFAHTPIYITEADPDGSLVDRAAFLKQTAQPVACKNLRAEDVLIRMFSAHDLVREPGSTSRDHAADTAIIHARTRYTKPDGAEGSGRYTDVWMRENGRWLCVSAHVTRL